MDRALRALSRAEVVVMVVDGSDGVTQQVRRLLLVLLAVQYSTTTAAHAPAASSAATQAPCLGTVQQWGAVGQGCICGTCIPWSSQWLGPTM